MATRPRDRGATPIGVAQLAGERRRRARRALGISASGDMLGAPKQTRSPRWCIRNLPRPTVPCRSPAKARASEKPMPTHTARDTSPYIHIRTHCVDHHSGTRTAATPAMGYTTLPNIRTPRRNLPPPPPPAGHHFRAPIDFVARDDPHEDARDAPQRHPHDNDTDHGTLSNHRCHRSHTPLRRGTTFKDQCKGSTPRARRQQRQE